jgi:hypothetical protein
VVVVVAVLVAQTPQRVVAARVVPLIHPIQLRGALLLL